MIRLRSQKLLSGVSGLAVLASFGLVSPALAAPTYPGPTNYGPITNDQSGAGATVLIGPDATVLANNPGNNDSFFNNLTMSGAGTKLRVQDSYLLGDIENTGTMLSSTLDGISIDSDSQIDGRIFNSGLIQGASQGIVIIDDSTVAGGIVNAASGTIAGGPTGILLGDNSEIFGGITNSGSITGTTFGISLNDPEVEFYGGILNNAGALISSGAGDAGIDWSGTIFSGGINNFGRIDGGDGIEVNSGTFTGGITNQAGGSIVGVTSAGIYMPGGLFNGNITNSGVIEGQGNNRYGIHLTGGTITGNIVNNQGGTIQVTGSTGTAIAISSGTITGNITNSGHILGEGTSSLGIVVSGAGTGFTGNITNNATGRISADSTAILISNGTFTGTITNNGTIFSDDADGINIATTVAFIGNVINNGAIAGSPIGGTGIQVNTPTFTGSIVNAGIIEASSDGINVAGTTFTGNVENSGTIIGDNADDGIEINVTTFNGDVINSGTIGGAGLLYVGQDGISLDGTTLDGNVLNSGRIDADNDGIQIESGLTVTGNVTNEGDIFADANNGGAGTGINIDGIVQGTLVNSGLISTEGTSGGTAIDVAGQVDGGITNSGSILGSDKGIDLSGADTATTITQTAGLLRGRNAGSITTALDMVNTFDDSFRGSGGVIDGNILADAQDGLVAIGSGTFAYSRGTATGLYHLDNDGTGLFVLGSTARGVDGEGVTVGAQHMWANGVGADFYLDDDTTITLVDNLDLDAGDSIEFFLKEGAAAADYGSIASGTTADLTGADVAAFIDPVTFAAPGGLSTYTYQNVITNVGADNFVNALDITTSSIFFTGTSVNDGANIDLVLNRLDFDDALVLAGAIESQNQQAVAGALEEIYDNVAFSPEFEALFTDLFAAGLTPEEIQFIFDELGGAEHAQLQQVTVNVANIFNNMVGERLDGSKHSLGGANLAMLERLYADAGTTANDGSHGMTRGRSGTSVWLRGMGQWVNVDADPEADGYDQDTNGLVGGIDHAVSANAMVGGAVAYTDSDVDFDEAGDAAEVESWQVGLYGTYGFGKFYVDGQASYAWNDINAARTITLPSASYVASSAYDSSAWTLSGELGAIWKLGRVNLQPSVNLAYVAADVDGFSETVTPSAPGLGLVVNGSDADSLATTVALRASGQWMMGKTTVVPDLKLGWRHEFENDRMSFGANFFEDLSAPAAFTIVSSEIAQDSLVVSTGATFGVSRNFEVFVDLNGLYNSDAASTNASGGVRLTW